MVLRPYEAKQAGKKTFSTAIAVGPEVRRGYRVECSMAQWRAVMSKIVKQSLRRFYIRCVSGFFFIKVRTCAVQWGRRILFPGSYTPSVPLPVNTPSFAQRGETLEARSIGPLALLPEPGISVSTWGKESSGFETSPALCASPFETKKRKTFEARSTGPTYS
jgi:hypothetical protein